MLTIPLSEFRQHSKQYIDAVEEGESLTLIRHSRPVAKVIPIEENKIKTPNWKKPGIQLEKNISLASLIIEERDE